MVKEQENVAASWAQVETQYQRRIDLIPNLVNVVQSYADFEKETLTDVINARSKASQITVDAENMDAAMITQLQDAQGSLGAALSKLMMVVEQYPDLKANENFTNLQVQLEGTENRINVARHNFNISVQNYNTQIITFPNNLFASFYGFEKKDYYHSNENSSDAPKVME